jgi:serine/threonine-protein kinase
LKIPKALKSRRFITSTTVVAVLVGLFFLLNNVVMPAYVRQGGQVKVISVVGMKFESAQRYLDSIGLDARQGEIRADNKYAIGDVISQNPIAGKIVNHGRRIYLTISGGEKLVAIPNLRGKTVRDGTFDLDRVGLKLGTVEYAVSDDFPANTIMSQSLQADLKVKRETYLSVVVSQGRSGERVAVPDLRSKTLKEAGQHQLSATAKFFAQYDHRSISSRHRTRSSRPGDRHRGGSGRVSIG